MINIAVLTASRAEYGLMRQLIFGFRDDPEIDFSLLVTGTHLSSHFGMTIKEIVEDNVPIAAQIEILVEKNGEIDTAMTMARAIERFSEFFSQRHFDLLFVDGDRYEVLAVCIAAVNNQIPIAHCGGGAVTEGANDEYWRHAITKLSYIHFPTMEKYKRRIILMGEDPERICVSGSPGLDNIRLMKYASVDELQERVGMNLETPFSLVTFHPATLEDTAFLEQTQELLNACNDITDLKYIFTMSNADKGGQLINKMLREFCDLHQETSVCLPSMGTYYYLSALKYCAFVMGNSSSGLIEAPSFGIPTINIGDRQKGRERAESVIDCLPVADDIKKAINKARDDVFREKCKCVLNPNGDGHASERIITKIKNMYKAGKISMIKKFYDFE